VNYQSAERAAWREFAAAKKAAQAAGLAYIIPAFTPQQGPEGKRYRDVALAAAELRKAIDKAKVVQS
jgi:hypothetical protein